jgi:flagella basal body P-ring formation protein FlgA
VWIATRTLAPGDTLGAADLRREVRTADRESARDPGDRLATGVWVARRPIEAGSTVRSHDVVRRPDVSAGDPVTLVSRAGDASVAVAAVARGSGGIGERIQVQNTVTGEIVTAVLVATGTAELVRPARPRRTSPGEAP